MSPSSLVFFFFFFNDTATTEIYTLSLHDALPISWARSPRSGCAHTSSTSRTRCAKCSSSADAEHFAHRRSEEHTSELQSHVNLVCRLLLEKKKKKKKTRHDDNRQVSRQTQHSIDT